MSVVLPEIRKGVAKKMGAKSHRESQDRMMLIGGVVVTTRELLAQSGMTLKAIRGKYRTGKRSWSDYGC